MVSIDQIILREVNPFDPVTFYTGNFWQKPQDQALTVDSIHQQVITEIESLLDKVTQDNRPRTLLLAGDSGSGKSYLLGRLKQQLNPKAFFAYIDPWPDSGFIWRHILRYTVDSLLHTPEGQQESQLLLWLKGLSVFRNQGLMQKLLGQRQSFISNLRSAYPSGIYKAKEFFGVLYDLTNPELHSIACDWLRGEDLDEDDLKALRVRNSITNEDTAQKILTNFGRISANSQPIVLCFDQLDNIPRTSDTHIDLQALFNVNSHIQTHYPQNFLIIISIINSTWRENAELIQPADKVRVNAGMIRLKPITLDEAEAIWQSRLYHLHSQADRKVPSHIFPLARQALETKFPRGKTNPRYTLMLGRQLFQEYKSKLVIAPAKKDTVIPDDDQERENTTRREVQEESTSISNLVAAFELIWRQEFEKNKTKIKRIRQFAAPELVRMLQESLTALEVEGIKPRFLPKYANYSLSYQLPNQTERVGLVWQEDANMNSFFRLMDCCEKTLRQNLCQTLYLIRAEGLGRPTNKGYKLWQKIFTDSPHVHLKPELKSVHYLATYHSLVNAACSQELVVGSTTPNLKELQALIRDSQVLHDCPLLQDLGIVPQTDEIEKEVDSQQVKELLLNLVKTQQFMGRQTLIKNARSEFDEVSDLQVERVIQQLCQEQKVQILDPNAKPEEQLVCLVP
ncbi:AAA family ATPase [Lyngbya aestuarii]|uniref:AAA family ATPase n=1 Tax=Lyngbya aestuarii TaxID=118322 RepID=UPI00403D7EDA